MFTRIRLAAIAVGLLLCASISFAQTLQSPPDGFWRRLEAPQDYCVVSSTANPVGKETFVYCSSGYGVNFFLNDALPETLSLYRFQATGTQVTPVLSSSVQTQSITSCVWTARVGNTGGPYFQLIRVPASGSCSGGGTLSKPHDR